MSNYIVPKEEWAKFGNQCYAFLNSVSQDFKYKLQKPDDKSFDDPLEYRKLATPIIAIFIAFGVSERDIMEERYKMAMKPHTRQTSLNYLKAKGYTQVRMIKLIIDNWSICPKMIRDLLRKYNNNFVFPNDPPASIEDEVLTPIQLPVVDQATSYTNPIPQSTQTMIDLHQPVAQPSSTPKSGFNFTMRDRAIAKYIKYHLIDYMGYNSQEALKRLFSERGATDFIFNNRYDHISLEDFNRIRFSVIDYGRANFTDMPGLAKSERIYYGKFKQILERFVVAMVYEPNVTPIQLTATTNQVSAPIATQLVEPEYVPQEPVQAQTNPLQTPQFVENVTNTETETKKVSLRTHQLIELLVEEMSVSQVRMAYALLQDSNSLQEFSKVIAVKFSILRNK
jgi:hypothetical protein